MLTIALVSQKGGSGKTTLALHLAVASAQTGRHAAIIDLDPQASAAHWADRREAALPTVLAAPASRLRPELDRALAAGVGRTLTAKRQAHLFTTLDQVMQLVAARDAAPEMGFMARLMALCSLPRARANETRTVDAFRTDCLRELKKIKDAWPNLHCRPVTGALVLAPSRPRIAPAQLRLGE